VTAEEFRKQLEHEGFAEIVTVEWPANGELGTHSHPFASRALVLAGEITLAVDGSERLYRPGEVFQLASGQPHTERYGPAGVRYLVGRR